MLLRGEIKANVRSREGIAGFPRVAFFLRGKLMVARPLVFAMLLAHCPKMLNRNSQASKSGHVRPLANPEKND